jgi:glutathione S-transferase
MANPILYGPAVSTYVRTVRLTMIEKNLDYDRVEIDLASGEHRSPAHRARHPFAKVPALEHDGTTLYETAAITRYLDAAFPEVSLTPTEPRQIGGMQQAISTIDAYVYPALVGTLVIQRLVIPKRGGTPDEAAIAEAMPMVKTSLEALDHMLVDTVWLSGGDLGLADLHLAPIMAYFSGLPEGQELLPEHTNLQRWWAGMSQRASMTATAP